MRDDSDNGHKEKFWVSVGILVEDRAKFADHLTVGVRGVGSVRECTIYS